MQNKNYTNFNQEVDQQDNITVGVPISGPGGQAPAPYFQQPQNPYQNGQMPYNNQMQNMAQPRSAGQPISPLMQMPLDYSKPISIKCPCCSMQVMTTVNQEPGNTAYLWAAVICCCISPCCTCLPLLTDKCMDKNHYCPSCGFNIMRKHRGFIDCV